MDINNIVALPEYLQIVIATGYIGHMIAKSGLRDNERKDELLYGIVVYGLFGYIIYDLIKPYFSFFLMPATAGVLVTGGIAVLWRKYLRHRWISTMQLLSVSNEDGTPDVWTGITQNTKVAPTQVSVVLKNGGILQCDDVQSFQNAPFPRYYSDNKGNIAIYVTHKINPGEESAKELTQTRDKCWGDRLTYIPSSEIANIDIRFVKI